MEKLPDGPAPLGIPCGHTMTYNSRFRRFPGKTAKRSYSTGHGERAPCPNNASVIVNGKPYCRAHAPRPIDITRPSDS